jgi:hypothetical protein
MEKLTFEVNGIKWRVSATTRIEDGRKSKYLDTIISENGDVKRVNCDLVRKYLK